MSTGGATSEAAPAPSTLLGADELLLWQALKRVGESMIAGVATEVEARTELSAPEYAVLLGLEEAPAAALGQSALAARLWWSRSRLSHLLSRMAARGLVQRESGHAPRGTNRILLTDAGRAALSAAKPVHAAAVRRHALSLIDADARRNLLALLEGIERRARHGRRSVSRPSQVEHPER